MCLLTMPEHLSKVLPFLPASLLTAAREDRIEGLKVMTGYDVAETGTGGEDGGNEEANSTTGVTHSILFTDHYT